MAAGFDIYSRIEGGVTVDNSAFATLSADGGYRFYAINLTTGTGGLLGAFDRAVVDIAIPIRQ